MRTSCEPACHLGSQQNTGLKKETKITNIQVNHTLPTFFLKAMFYLFSALHMESTTGFKHSCCLPLEYVEEVVLVGFFNYFGFGGGGFLNLCEVKTSSLSCPLPWHNERKEHSSSHTDQA